VYALLAALLLWRAGLRLWVLSPFTFLMSTVVEIVMKTAVNQSGERLMEFHRSTYYPFATVSLDGTFPSGHSSRTAFFCVFLAVLLWSRGTMLSRAAAVGFIVLIPLVGFTRLYIGDHWLSDVAAGILLGAALALLVAPPVAARLQKANSYLPSVVRK
jgi:membrane-associated phospholipid phosphatase